MKLTCARDFEMGIEFSDPTLAVIGSDLYVLYSKKNYDEDNDNLWIKKLKSDGQSVEENGMI